MDYPDLSTKKAFHYTASEMPFDNGFNGFGYLNGHFSGG